ncbi:hypothetical protein ACFQWB_00835 [Paenibacillus thermoaerophilus]|uniref:GGDEF domain-containing protein n=1 Tax=Paenibacillus thermoaerophilus TaxID=1215385 RepID=A0ABW2V106_9BACL|nr:hypothetical protein [Paenibacillus thermoaerophilus]
MPNPHIAIGIIGPQTFVDQIENGIRSFPTFSPVYWVCEHDEQVPALAERLAEQAEVLLVSSPLAQRLIKEKNALSLPVHCVPVREAALYKALLRAYGAGRPVAGGSIDSLTELMLARACSDLGLSRDAFALYDGPAYASKEDLVAFHAAAYDGDPGKAALTGSESVARELRRRGIPSLWLQPADQDVIVTLERALLSTETRRSKETQIVVGLINVDDFGKMVQQRSSEHEVQKLKLDIHRMVLDYVESLEGYLTPLGGDEYLFFTTRGIFERETGGYKTIPLGKDANKTLGISISLGIGFGQSANEAGTNARSALRKAKEAGGNTCFIVREDRTLIGPLEMGEPVRNVLALTDAELIKRAEDAGMTSAYLSRLLTHQARTGRNEYMVHELASLLGITVRSAHRLLQMWMDNGLVEITGIEKVPRGRPRQLFRFTLLDGRTDGTAADRFRTDHR